VNAVNTVRLEWRRQFASSRPERLMVLAAVSTLTLAFALFLWWFVDVWMILPFAGLEIGCVAVAFWWLERAVDDRDTVEVSEEDVRVERRRRRQVERIVLGRHWVSAVAGGDGRQGIQIRHAGRSVQLLEFLPEDEQRQAIRTLRQALERY